MARDILAEGESGLIRVFPQHQRPTYEPSKCRISFYDGSVGYIFNADEPDRLRSSQFGAVWADEVSSWRYGLEAWQNLTFGLRLGGHPQAIVTTTSNPNQLTIGLMKGLLVMTL